MRHFLFAMFLCLLTLPAFAEEPPVDYHGTLVFNYGADKTVFEGLPRFEDFPASHAPRKTAKDIDFTSNKSARKYKTRLRAALAEGANFNGHYAVALWGCGTGCQESKIVDIETGKVTDIFTTSMGVVYKKDSALLIANMPEAATVDWEYYCMLDWDNPRFLTFRHGRLKQLKKLDLSTVWKNKVSAPCAAPAP